LKRYVKLAVAKTKSVFYNIVDYVSWPKGELPAFVGFYKN
jgi:hypothetical protein